VALRKRSGALRSRSAAKRGGGRALRLRAQARAGTFSTRRVCGGQVAAPTYNGGAWAGRPAHHTRWPDTKCPLGAHAP